MKPKHSPEIKIFADTLPNDWDDVRVQESKPWHEGGKAVTSDTPSGELDSALGDAEGWQQFDQSVPLVYHGPSGSEPVPNTGTNRHLVSIK